MWKKIILIFVVILILFYVFFCMGITGNIGRKIKFFLAYKLNIWEIASPNSISSGNGSEIHNTRLVSNIIPSLVQDYNIQSILDCGCGDLNWMRYVLQKPELKNVKYTGLDLIMADKNKKKFPQYDFKKLDIVSSSKLPSYDLAIAKDIFIHLSNNEIKSAINNMRNSGIKYLLCNIDEKSNNNDLLTHARSINLEKKPFNLDPIEYFKSDGNDQSYHIYEL